MKKTIYTLLVMLLLGCRFQLRKKKAVKRPNSSKPKTEKTQKKNTSSNKSKASKQTASKQTQSASPSNSSSKTIMPQAQKDRVIQEAIADMVWVSGGSFMMGATPDQGNDAGSNEKPVHQVTVSRFYISKYEVTQELWLAVMDKNPSYYKGDLRRPVEWVSWNDCQDFIRKLNQLTGKKFRLPTEAEWEYAARGGIYSKGYKYSGSNTLSNVAWYYDNSGNTTHAVGQKMPNELGLYDMNGNVWEWCQDWYGNYSSVSQTNPSGPSSGSDRVCRGGAWSYQGWVCAVSHRIGFSPIYCWSFDGGLRLAMSPF